MKSLEIIKHFKIQYLLFILIGVVACKKEDNLGEAPRLFRPTLKGELTATANYIEASWQKVKDVQSYTVQISRDTFKTIDFTIQVDSNYLLAENLRWNQLYQLKVRAVAADTAKSSDYGILGEVKTEKFPTILLPVDAADVVDNAVRVKWDNMSTDVVTSIKVLLESDSSVVKEVPLTPTDVTNQYKIVTGLQDDTGYIIYIYSGTKIKGWDNYRTKAKLTGDIVDLRQIENNSRVLFDTLSKVNAGATILLARGQTYDIPSSYVFTKAVKIMSGVSLQGDPAVLSLTGNFDANGVIDFLAFEDLTIATVGAEYFMNVGYTAKIGELIFENCKTRGTFTNSLVRLKTANDEISKVKINNCVMGDIGIAKRYALLQAGASNSAKFVDIEITNSTFYKLYYFIRQDGIAGNSLIISDCTFDNIINQGGYFVNYSVGSPTTFQLTNTLIGKTLDPTNAKWIKSSAGYPVINNVYTTSDAVYSGDAIPATIGIKNYVNSSTDLFTDPSNGDFTIKDVTFSGRSTAGDPRWRL